MAARPKPFGLQPQEIDAATRLSEAMSCSPVLAQVLINRGMRTPEEVERFLFGGLETMHPPDLLDGLSQAADIVTQAVREGTRIVIHGDYDADGVSATALLVSFLRDHGALVEPYIPHRIDEGYGLSREGIIWAADEGFGLLVSVDCGSSSPQEVALARQLGLKVVITDHHMVGTPPEADAFVNPRSPNGSYPFPHLSGAGVAFKLAQAVSQRLGCGHPENYLDLAAIGTVGDVVPLTGENRVLVREGLEVMARMERPGIAALANVAGLLKGEQPILTSRNIAFDLAPRINACGRLEHARTAAELLLERNPLRAQELAQQVDLLNQKRRDAETAQREEAEKIVLERGAKNLTVIVEASASWHQGLVGITANRLLDRFGVPAFVISLGPDGSAKGSARSPAHLDLFACMTACKDLFTHYGGHPRAGGFSMRAEDIDRLRERLQEVVPSLAQKAKPAWTVDVEVPLQGADVDLADQLEQLAPLGQANPAPLFLARGVQVRFPQLVKERHLKFLASQDGASRKSIGFFLGDRLQGLRADGTYDILYHLEKDVWQGEERSNLVIKEIYGAEIAEERTEQPLPEWVEDNMHHSTEGAPSVGTIPTKVHSTGPWVDGRAVSNRGRYLADLVREGRPITVLARRNLLQMVRRVVVGDPQSPPPPHLRILAYGDPLPDTTTEFVLFSPPPTWETVEAVARVGNPIHVLFGDTEVREEETLMRVVSMNRTRVAAVYRLLSKHSPFNAAVFPKVANHLGTVYDRVDTVRVVARILTEIGVAREAERGQYEWTGAKAALEQSTTYQRYEDIDQAFARVRQAFTAWALPGMEVTLSK